MQVHCLAATSSMHLLRADHRAEWRLKYWYVYIPRLAGAEVLRASARTGRELLLLQRVKNLIVQHSSNRNRIPVCICWNAYRSHCAIRDVACPRVSCRLLVGERSCDESDIVLQACAPFRHGRQQARVSARVVSAQREACRCCWNSNTRWRTSLSLITRATVRNVRP